MSSCADVFIELLSTKNWAVSYSTSLEGVLADSDEDESRRGTLLRKFHMQKLNRISTAETQFIKSKIRVTGLHMEEDFHVCYSTLQKQVDVQMASSTDVFLGAAKQDVLTACDRKEIQQLCLDCSHKTYIAVTVPHSLLLPELDCGLKKIARRGIGYKIQTVLLDEQ
ncbi:hypothetical protein DPMN_031824 [Dreissena polymorpha]|uniref:Uncharacterized protein n=1 Tax=Dreissena polymorpha TaxID=45954 RepID=A0A9D4M3H7_DREPO|nr:hypothetical protein DPMN_031824 [Dreissena polymorpha]